MSESIAYDSITGHRPTSNVSAAGCIYRSEETLENVARELSGLGIDSLTLHLGAADKERARTIGQRLGIANDIDPEDPLKDVLPAGRQDRVRAAVDRAGWLGALLGALAGALISFTAVGQAMPAGLGSPMLESIALWFVLGAIIGSVLGAALGPQPSTHAAFRLIDGMQDGACALVVIAPVQNLDTVTALMERTGGEAITRA